MLNQGHVKRKATGGYSLSLVWGPTFKALQYLSSVSAVTKMLLSVGITIVYQVCAYYFLDRDEAILPTYIA